MQLCAPEASTVQDAWAREALWAFTGMDMAFIGTDMASGASTPMPGVMPGAAAGKGTRTGFRLAAGECGRRFR
jgi:hypothetical protein